MNASPAAIHWGAPTGKARGPVVAGLDAGAARNAIGVHAATYSIYSALAVATATHAVLTRHFDGPVRAVLLWPLGEAFVGALTLRAGLRAWKDQGVYWRRTFYPRAVLEAGRRLDPVTFRVRPPEPAVTPE